MFTGTELKKKLYMIVEHRTLTNVYNDILFPFPDYFRQKFSDDKITTKIAVAFELKPFITMIHHQRIFA